MDNIEWVKTKDKLPQGNKRGLFSKERIAKVFIKDSRGNIHSGFYQERGKTKRFVYLEEPGTWMNPELHQNDWRIINAKKWAYR